MTDNKMIVNQQVIDELVSGELQGEAYRRTLRAFDEQPEQWRHCALAFLEAQAFEREMKALVSGSELWGEEHGTTQALPTEFQPNLNVESTEASNSSERAQSRLAMKVIVQSLSIAALLMIGVGFGWGIAEMANSSTRGTTPGLQDVADNSPQPTDGFDSPDEIEWSEGLSPDSDLHWASYVDGASAIPLDRRLPPSLRRAQEKGHVDIEFYDALMPVTGEGGQTLLYPVQELRVKPKVVSY